MTVAPDNDNCIGPMLPDVGNITLLVPSTRLQDGSDNFWFPGI